MRECKPVPDRPGVFWLMGNKYRPRIEWDSIRLIATIEGQEYSRIEKDGRALNQVEKNRLICKKPWDFMLETFDGRRELILFYAVSDGYGLSSEVSYQVLC